MAICTFFGHRDCPDEIKSQLNKVLVDLITNQDVEDGDALLAMRYRVCGIDRTGDVLLCGGCRRYG